MTEGSNERDERLALVLDELAGRAAKGEFVDIDAEAARHPDLSVELRDLWGAVMLADAVGSQPETIASDASDKSKPVVTFELPYQFGDYELLEELGRGGMGIVYRARQLSLNRIVAIKMLLRGQFASETDRARFQAEAEAAAGLDHPNIVPVYEVGSHEGHLFFSMKHIEGQTLSQKLSTGPMESSETARIMAIVSRAIDYAHRRGVLHRDLKPSNIMVDDEGQPHVTDFGLAKQVTGAESLTRTGAILGTPAYMAPEQAAGNRGEVGITSDVYSLSCILYHMLTGNAPFVANSPVDVVLKVLEQDPPLPRSIKPNVNRDLEMVTLRGMQKPQDLRYSSAANLASDLEAFLNDEPLSANTGRLTQVFSMMFRETHHAAVLENWGLLWMWHSLALIVVCTLTNALYLTGFEDRLPYFLLWTAGLGTWAGVFWLLRRRLGPVTFVERQIAHVWAASMASIGMLFPIEWLLGLDVLKLSPILALSSGMVFLVKAGILSGTFYFYAVVLFLTALPMAAFPDYSHFIFGVVSAACFFFPGWKYHRQRLRSQTMNSGSLAEQ
ncbi:MAG: serine/threonine protein kinase [Planctomycetales bacterium]|nr:serine/threonine protein kinase [Planctomycetales bacterium]